MNVSSLALFALLLAPLSHPAFSQDSSARLSDVPVASTSDVPPSSTRDVPSVHFKKVDRNRSIYYKNKFEFSLQTGWLPNNIPFVFDFLVRSCPCAYNTPSGPFALMSPNLLFLNKR